MVASCPSATRTGPIYAHKQHIPVIAQLAMRKKFALEYMGGVDLDAHLQSKMADVSNETMEDRRGKMVEHF